MVTVGIDPHKHVHIAVAVDADGRWLTRPLTVKNDANLIGVLLKWTRTRRGEPIRALGAVVEGAALVTRGVDGFALVADDVRCGLGEGVEE
ncbi:hypothetical protein [Streptomyces chartreusis]|uniref:hypothetical protein n=1 Tax=Streptomyces chartreusis TaxID=1969 RepID=UPI00381A1BB8